MKTRKLLIATHNPAKFEELKKGVKSTLGIKVEIFSLDDLRISRKPKETGTTFEENVLIKAKYYADLAGMPTIADDGGLIIKVLKNEPGVKSRRWPGYEANDEKLINYTLEKLRGLPKEKKAAYLKTVVCFYHPQTKTTLCEDGKIEGYIADKPSKKRIKGYPYRALFIVKKYGKYYDELTDAEHKETNHRLKAIRKLAKKIDAFL